MVAIWMPVVIIAILIFVNGFFVAAEFAIAASPRARVAQMAEEGSTAAVHVLTVLSDRDLMNRYISTAQVGITLASLGLGMYGEHAIADWLLAPLHHVSWLGIATAHTVATVASVAFLTYLHVVLGEMIPKSIALHSAAGAAIYLSATMAVAERLFRPLTAVLNWAGNFVLSIMRIPVAGTHDRLVSAQELAYIVEESSEGGYLAPAEQVYLENVIDFHERSVGQIMTPRTRLVAIADDASLDLIVDTVSQHRHSRFPVYQGDRDNIVGILHLKDLARRLATGEKLVKIQDILRPAVYVPESLALDDLLAQFRAEHIQVAIVLDEYGGTAGLVTLEDLAEEIIGEIQDEFDQEVEPFVAISSNRLRVRGDLLLDELTQHYDLEFVTPEAETVGGLIMTELGQVASPGDAIDVNGVRFEVESMDGLAVATALIDLPNIGRSDEEVGDKGNNEDG